MSKDFGDDVIARLLDISSKIVEGNIPRQRLILAFSGGADSSALLSVLSRQSIKSQFDVVAAHVDHGLQNESGQWAKHCRKLAADHDIPFRAHVLDSGPKPGENHEAWARSLRYGWFRELVAPHDLLLTAHHQDDQLETFLLQLMRGAGPHGLRGIREIRRFGAGYLVRPMLQKSREEIIAYVNDKRISYIEDPSNRDLDFDRNYLRSEILPKLRNRWPHIGTSVLHASHIQQLVAEDYDQRAEDFLAENISVGGGLKLSGLLGVTEEFKFVIFRRWCESTGVSLLERRHFDEITKAISSPSPSPTMKIEWKNAVLRYFRGELFLDARQAAFDSDFSSDWNISDPKKLPNGELSVVPVLGAGLDPRFRNQKIKVGYYRREGERCHPTDRQHSQSLKKLFQEWQVPPWLRNQVPLVWVDGKIAAVVPYCTCRGFSVGEGQEGLIFQFQPVVCSE